MKYKIGDVSRILGISPDLLRYYEKKGIVHPAKDKYNDYRYYEAWDINFLMDSLWYKSFGFPVSHVAEIIGARTADEIVSDMETKEAELEDAAKHMQLLAQQSRRHRLNLEKTKRELGECRIECSSEIVRYLHRYNYIYDYSDEFQKLSRQWLKYMPFTQRCFEIALDTNGSVAFGDYQWGFSLSMEYAGMFGVEIKPPIVHLPPARSIYTVFSSEGKGKFSSRLLDYTLDYARGNGLEICGNPQGNLLCSVQSNGRLTGFFEVWIPIKETQI